MCPKKWEKKENKSSQNIWSDNMRKMDLEMRTRIEKGNNWKVKFFA